MKLPFLHKRRLRRHLIAKHQLDFQPTQRVDLAVLEAIHVFEHDIYCTRDHEYDDLSYNKADLKDHEC